MHDLRIPLLCLTTVAALAGCDSLSGHTVKVDNPVFGPAPPRVAVRDDRTNGDAYVQADPTIRASDSPSVVPVDFAPQPVADDELAGSQVVATVNGSPIFASEILERYAIQLEQAKKQLPPEEFRRQRDMVIKRDLPNYIDRKVLVQSLQSTLKKEQMDMLSAHMDRLFAEECESLKKQLEVTTNHELDQKLREQHTSLDSLKGAFINQRMAMEYLAVKSKYDKELGRPDLLAYYRDHIDEYSFPAQVKWQQIEVKYARHGGKDGALDHLQKAIDELRRGVEFGEVAMQLSDGPTASNRGHWGWTTIGSLADKQVEETLFATPVGHVSQVIVGDRSYQLVKVVERKDAGVKPFEELQDEIAEILEKEARKAASGKVLEELRSKAIIESAFIDPPATSEPAFR